jgi:hypothetical protein
MPPERLSEAVLKELAISQLWRIQSALRDGLHVPGAKGKPRRLSMKDRDAILIEEIATVLTELYRK